MGSLKTFASVVIALCAWLPAHPAASPGELHLVFSGCAGRFSAELEHAWLMGEDTAEEIADRRRTFVSLVEATIPPDNGKHVLAHRLDHKLAHASLLTIATFSQNTGRARAARLAADTYRQECEHLLLDG